MAFQYSRIFHQWSALNGLPTRHIRTGDLVRIHVGQADVRAGARRPIEARQIVADGQPKVAARLEEDALLLAVLDERPVRVAELLVGGHAVLVAQRQLDRGAVADDALRKGVRAQQFLRMRNGTGGVQFSSIYISK